MRKSLAALVLLPFLMLGKPTMSANAEEPKQKPQPEFYFEPVVSDSENIKINDFTDLITSNQTIPDYIGSYSFFSGNNLYLGVDLPITSSGASDMQDLLRNIGNGTVNSYSDLINSSNSMSKLQKIIIASIFANSAYHYDYVISYNGKTLSQEDFFKKIQKAFNSQADPIGLCRHIAINSSTLANDLGVRTSAVTGAFEGIGHTYDISKLDGVTAVWDGGSIILAQTRNIEKALEIYQLKAKSVTFQHQFFEDSKFKYSFVTKDGENYLAFTGYDPSTDTIKKALFNTLPPVIPLTLNFTQNKSISEIELNVYGMFAKKGEIRGDSLSPMEKLSLTQAGYSGNLASPQLPGFSIRPSLSFMYGEIKYKEGYSNPRDVLFGVSGNTILSYNYKDKLKLSLRSGCNFSFNDLDTFFYDLPLEAGVSYKFSGKNFQIEPYIISQFGLLPSDFGAMTFVPQFKELKTGTAMTIPFAKDSAVYFDPYFTFRDYEKEIGADAKLKIKPFELAINGYLSQHDYDFAPDRMGINIGTKVSLTDRLSVGANYKTNLENYDGEVTGTSAVSFTGTMKY